MLAQQISIQKLSVVECLGADWLSSMANKLIDMKADSPISSELKCPAKIQIGEEARIRLAMTPARLPNKEPAVSPKAMMVKKLVKPPQRRACHSPIPKSLKAKAVAQIWRGGFSKYL